MATITQTEFPVGTGIYRQAGSGMDQTQRVPCRYRDIPYPLNSPQGQALSSL